MIPKPTKRGPKPRCPIPRSTRTIRRTPVRKRSGKRASVEAADRRWSQAVRALAGGTCAKCGSYASDAHHVRSKKAHPGLRWRVENGIALCREHHDAAHADPETFRAWFRFVRSEDAAAIWGEP